MAFHPLPALVLSRASFLAPANEASVSLRLFRFKSSPSPHIRYRRLSLPPTTVSSSLHLSAFSHATLIGRVGSSLCHPRCAFSPSPADRSGSDGHMDNQITKGHDRSGKFAILAEEIRRSSAPTNLMLMSPRDFTIQSTTNSSSPSSLANPTHSPVMAISKSHITEQYQIVRQTSPRVDASFV